ncbi:MAG TPA: S8 family serine peptidase [Chloroflexota bacterium]
MLWRDPQLRLAIALAVLLSGGAVGCRGNSPLSQPVRVSRPSEFLVDQFVVKFKDDTAAEVITSFNTLNRVDQLASIPQLRADLMQIPAGTSLGDVVGTYSRHPAVEFAEPNYIGSVGGSPANTASPPQPSSQWALAKIHASEAWGISKGSSSVTIAVIDTGVALSGQNLQGKLIPGPDLILGGGEPADRHGQGTGVAGIIGTATSSGDGIAGLAQMNPILIIRDADANGNYATFLLAKAITYAVDQGARVINISQGATSESSVVNAAVNYAWARGAVLVAAAGDNGGPVAYPAATPHVLAVGATDQSDAIWSESSRGPQLAVVAPGVNILTTTKDGGYGMGTATAFSAPFVSALAGLILSANPELSNQQVVDIIEKTTDDICKTGGKHDPKCGFGRINALNALQAATGKTT